MRKTYSFLFICLSILFASCTGSDDGNRGDSTGSTPVPSISYSLISVQPHDTSHFTEGLEFYNNTILESIGLPGKSKLLQVDLATGKVLKQVKLDSIYFGEGITVLHDTLYQLTWQEHKVFVYSVRDFRKIKELPLNGEGWGLTNDGKNLIASNGSSKLYFYEPSDFKLLHELDVTENGSMVPNINELEYVNGFIYANQWQYNYILKINPSTGAVVAKLDLTEIANKVEAKDPHSEYMNGIAYNPETKKFYITGKYWPEMYEIQFER